MANRIQLRRGTAAEWTAANPVLGDGEPGVEKDTGKQKFGNGTSAWVDLPYASAGPQGPAGVADDESVEALVADTGSATRTALNATYLDRARLGMGERPWHLDAYNKFFKLWTWVDGQGIAATTTTASAAAGATTLAVASGTGLVNGTVLVMGAGTAQQQTVKIASGGETTTLTLTTPLEFAVASGASVTPLWSDTAHMNGSTGWKAWSRFIMEARRPDGTRVINKTGKIVFFGNSWMVPALQADYESQVKAVYPDATVVMKGVSGNQASQMLARFDTDVPADADFVVLAEPGVNDIVSDIPLQTLRENLVALTKKVWEIGAVPIFVGATPISNRLTFSARLARDYNAAFATPENFPATGFSGATPTTAQSLPYGSVAYGHRALELATQDSGTAFGYWALRSAVNGVQNTAVGQLSAYSLTNGNYNTAVGQGTLAAAVTATSNTAIGRASLAACTGNNNTAVGDESLKAATTPNGNTAVGRKAGALVTTGASGLFLGVHAGESPNFVAGNATTTGASQTLVGAYTGQSSATQRSKVTALGAIALVGADDATALGAEANAGHTRSVALGKGTTTTATDQLAVGARHQLMGNISAEPATPTAGGIIYVQDGALKYKGSAGTVTTLAPA